MANRKMSLGHKKKKRVVSSARATYPRPENAGVYKLGSDSERVRERRDEPSHEAPARETVRQRAPSKNKYHSTPAKKKPRPSSSGLKSTSSAKKKRTGVNGVVFRGFVAVAVLVLGVALSVFILFKIGSIKVIGNEKYSTAQIVEASEIELGDNLFAPSSAVTQKRIGKALPYIKSVTFKHELPDTLVICVKESEAKYAFKASTKYLLTDDELKLLEISDKLPPNAAVIEGVGLKGAEIGEQAKYKDSTKGEYVDLIENELAKNKLENITLIDVKNPVELRAIYNDQITILFGQSDEMEYKCSLAAKAIESVLAENKNSEGTVNVKQAPETRQAYFNPSTANSDLSA